jgi:hypothetical protein
LGGGHYVHPFFGGQGKKWQDGFSVPKLAVFDGAKWHFFSS